jgi:hypothetical protein
MGETVLLAVEETPPKADEPPICGSKDPHTAPSRRQLQPKPTDGDTPPTLYAPHTLTPEEVAEKLGVDIQYVSLLCSQVIVHLLTIIAMDSLTLKRNLASSSMALTRLRELKGFPCGKFC